MEGRNYDDPNAKKYPSYMMYRKARVVGINHLKCTVSVRFIGSLDKCGLQVFLIGHVCRFLAR